jgi:tetratricopeptide (TPR) repeat protein
LEALYRSEAHHRLSFYDGLMPRYLGEILLNIDEKRISEAEDWIRKAIEADTRNGMMFALGKDYAAYAELLKRKGDTPKAKEHLGKAVEMYEKCGADGWVERAKKELQDLSSTK